MTFVPVMWSVWGALVAVLVSLKLYCDRIARDEDDQLILDDAFNDLRAEQAAIVAKVNRVEPIRRVVMWMAVAMTAVVLVYYIMDIVRQLQ